MKHNWKTTSDINIPWPTFVDVNTRFFIFFFGGRGSQIDSISDFASPLRFVF